MPHVYIQFWDTEVATRASVLSTHGSPEMVKRSAIRQKDGRTKTLLVQSRIIGQRVKLWVERGRIMDELTKLTYFLRVKKIPGLNF